MYTRIMASEESRPLLGSALNINNQPQSPTDSEYLNKLQNGKLYLATFAAVLGPLSFGYVLGYSSPAIPDLKKIEDSNLRLDNNEASWFGSIVTLGAAAGGIFGGWLVDRVGRKLSLMLCAFPFIFGFTLIISARYKSMLYIGRILTGLATGVTSLVVPVYISETSHPGVRGTLGSCVQLMVVTGIMGSYVAGLGLDWRLLAMLGCFPPFFMTVLMYFMPETPRFLLTQQKQSEAITALQFLRGPHVDHNLECILIESNLNEQENRLRWADFKNPTICKPFVIGILLMLFQQFSGINAIMFYAETIFEDAGFKNSSIASVIVGAIQVVFTAAAALIMDKAGRKILLIVSGTIMTVSTAVFGVYFKIVEVRNNSSLTGIDLPTVHTPVLQATENHLAWLALASTSVFIAGFAIGWGPIPWLVMSEIFPVKARGVASGACVLTNWLSAFLITKEFHDLMVFLGSYGTFWFFSSSCALSVIFTCLCIPETKGKTLEQIEAHFRGMQGSNS